MKKYLLAALVIVSASAFAKPYENVTVFGGVITSGSQHMDISSTVGISGKGDVDSDKMGYTIGAEAYKSLMKSDKVKLEAGFGVKYETSVEKNGNTSVAYIPVYGSLKGSFIATKKINIFLQGILGYSIPKEGDYINDLNDTYKRVSSKELSGGLYTGVGLGMDYGKYNATVTYSMANSEYKAEDIYGDSITYKMEDKKVALTVGYKFGK